MLKVKLLPQLMGFTHTQIANAEGYVRRIDTLFKLSIMPLLNIANSAVVDAEGAITARGLYRHNIKQWTKKAKEGFADAERTFFDGMDKELCNTHREFWDIREENLGYLLKSPNPLKIDRERTIPLFEAIKAAMANQGEEDIVFKATLEYANALNDAAVFTFVSFVKAMRASYKIDVSEALAFANSHKQKQNFGKVCDALCKYKNGYGFYRDKFVNRALDAISLTCLDYEAADCDFGVAVDGNAVVREVYEKDEYYHNLANELTEAHDNNLVADLVVKHAVYDAASDDTNIDITQRQYELLLSRPFKFIRMRRGVNGDRTLYRIGKARRKGENCKLKLVERIAV